MNINAQQAILNAYITNNSSLYKIYFCLPYTGQHGLQLYVRNFVNYFHRLYPHISIRFVFRPTCRLSDFFPFKDRIPFALRSHVVYKYKCQCCGALYVGQNTPTYTHANLRTWEFRPKLVISSQSHKCLLF